MRKYVEKLRKLNQEEKALVWFGIACISFALCLLVVILPLWQKVQANEQKLSVAEKRLAVYKTFAKQTDYAEQNKEQAELLANLQKRLPKSLDVAEQVPQYYAWAQASGVQLSGVKLLQHKQAKKAFVPVQLDMQGDYSNILKFLAKLEREGSFVVLEKVIFKGNANGKVEVNAQMNVYLAKS